MSAQKVRLVLDVVRGKNAREALAILKFLPQRAARSVGGAPKCLLSARKWPCVSLVSGLSQSPTSVSVPHHPDWRGRIHCRRRSVGEPVHFVPAVCFDILRC